MKNSLNDTYRLQTSSVCANILVMLLIALTTSIIPLLLNNHQTVIFYTSLPFYITVVILFGCVIYFGTWGLLIAALSFCICGAVLDVPMRVLVINCLVNTLQLWILLLVFRWLRRLKFRNRNKYAEGIFYLSQYNFLLIVAAVSYFVCCVANRTYSEAMIVGFAAAIFAVTLIKVIVSRDLRLLCYTFFLAFLPSFVCSLISAVASGVPRALMTDYVLTWSLSNYIMLQTFGYLIFQLFFRTLGYRPFREHIVGIDICSFMYYIAMLIWNLLIIWVYSSGILAGNVYICFFPWLLGNIFFGFNLCFSFDNDADAVGDKFQWYEQRVITVEKNTGTIITIITFLLPLSAALMRNVPDMLYVLFVANIFCACLSVGLIWVPSSNLKFIAFLKGAKTVFFLFSISLLLVSAMLVVFCR